MASSSALARIQQLTTFAILAAALGWWFHHWPQSPVLAAAGALLIALGHALLLALQFGLMLAVGTGGAVPRPRPAAVLRAWAAECWHAARVFGWRQPFRWRAVPDRVHPAPQGCRGIVFVHGFVCNRGFWTPWLRQAQAHGLPFIALNLEPVFGSIDEYAPLVDEAVARLTRATGSPPVLVCHSMGGLVARAWLRAAQDPTRVAHVITIGSPHAGTWLAQLSHRENGRQMRSGGEWLAQLARHTGQLPAPLLTCWWSDCDNIVFPAPSASWPGADNRLLPGAAHVHLAFEPAVMRHAFGCAGIPVT